MLIEQTTKELYVHRKQCRLTVSYIEKMRKGHVHGAKLKLMLDSKTNNIHPIKLTAEIDMEEEQLKTLYRKLDSSRLYIHRHSPRLTILEDLSIILRDTTHSFTQKQISTVDEAVNHGHKYWSDGTMQACISWPISASILMKNDGKRELLILEIPSDYFHSVKLDGKSIHQLQNGMKRKPWVKEEIIEQKNKICEEFKRAVEKNMLKIDEEMSLIITNSSLFPNIPLTTFQQRKWEILTEKEKLFQHIFITELVTHMIVNQFGRNKRKQHQYRDGKVNYWYEDEQLQAMRSCGHRFSEFRDYSVETFNPPPQECEQSDSESELLIESDEEYKQQKKKKKSEVSRLGNKIKRVLKNKYSKKRELVENFMVISGDKSQINKKRYCLHQMTRETDKTQALINFVQLTFSAYWPRQNLLSHETYSHEMRKRTVSYFMKKFKVKRSTPDCLEEYTRESFFHRVLNIGLRIFNQPHELTYLRLPFSHIFWSIKTLYQRHKKAIWQFKNQKNEKRVIKVYRGFQMSKQEIKRVKKNIGAFIQMEGFLSTTLYEQIVAQFTANMFMTINVPVKNLKGLHDNGFAHITNYSDNPGEREVLFNAFNMFKIQSLGIKMIKSRQVYEMTVEYGGIKQVEDKTRKSQILLESQFLMKVEEEKIACVKHVLNMKEEKMTPQMVQQLREALAKEEEKLKKWKSTLKKQEEKEWTTAYEELSKWEQELLDNCTHLQHTIQHIDNYGQLLLTLGDYERAIAYGRRMARQGERDRAIEGWQWMKTPCLPQKLSLHRLLLAQSYHRQCRWIQQAEQLQAVKELYTCMNIPSSHHSYTQLITQLNYAYEPLLLSGYQDKYWEYKDMLDSGVSNKKNLYYDANDTKDIQREIWELSWVELQGRIVKQREKVKQMNITQGNYTNQSQHQHFILIYMLFQQQWRKYPQTRSKRDYKQIQTECLTYLHNTTHSSHTYTTITLVWGILLQAVNDSKIGRRWLCIVCQHFTSFLTHLYHEQQIYIVYECICKCELHGQWMTLQKLLLQLTKTQISCPIPFWAYDMMMKIYTYIWGISRECMTWVKNTQHQLHSSSDIGRKQREESQFIRFPHSIAGWDGKKEFNFVLNGITFSYYDVIKRCLDIEDLYTHLTSRQIQHLQSYQSNLLLGRKKTIHREVKVWQSPSELWNKADGEYEIAMQVVKGELTVAMLYLHHHPYYTRPIYTISKLHLPRESYTAFDSLVNYDQSTQELSPQSIKKIRRRPQYLVTLGRKQGKKKGAGMEGKKKAQASTIIKSYTSQSQEWKQLKYPLLLLERSMREGRHCNLLQAKAYCRLSIDNAADMDRVMRSWDGHQRVFARRQFNTLQQINGKNLPLYPLELEDMSRGQSLTQLMKQQIRKEIQQGSYLQQQQYLMPTFKGLLQQHSLPMQLIIAIFHDSQKCGELIKLFLDKQELRNQLTYQLQQLKGHYPDQSVQKLFQFQILMPDQSVQKLFQFQILMEQQSFIRIPLQKYLQYDYSPDDDKYIKEWMRYGVLRVLVDKQQTHSLLSLLSPIIYFPYTYAQQQEYNLMKDGYEAFLEACLDSKSCLLEGWGTARWWEPKERQKIRWWEQKEGQETERQKSKY